MLNKITSGLRWRYELYLSEYIDLFGSVSYFVQFGLAWFKNRHSATVIYVFANKRNVGDYLSHQGVQQIVNIPGPMMLCTPVAQKLYHYQLSYLRQHNPSCHVVIGGGGLLQGVFSDFWQALVDSKLSYSLVGVGVNRMPGRPELAPELLHAIFTHATALGLRDPMTVELVQPECQSKVRLHTCPAHNFVVEYINRVTIKVKPALLHMLHEADLRLAKVDIDALKDHVQSLAHKHGLTYVESNNMHNDFSTAIAQVASSQVVVSSRLHGCIMSYATGRPCIGIACDEKLSQYIQTHTQLLCVQPNDGLLDNLAMAVDKVMQGPAQQITTAQLTNSQAVGQAINEHIS